MKLLIQIFFLLNIFAYSNLQAQCLAVGYVTNNVACRGTATGAITVAPASGQSPYTYVWVTGTTPTTSAAGLTITGLSAGAHTITVTDNLGCDDVRTIIITEPATSVSATAAVTSNYNGHDIDCNGNATGEAIVTANGGTAGYSYLWSNQNQTTASATGLSAGNNCVTVTDSNGCAASTCVVLTEPSTVSVAIGSQTNVNCKAGNTGEATAVASGGAVATSYAFLWSGSETTASVTGLPAGVHCVSATDINGCVASTCVTITEPATALSVIATGINLSCNGVCDGNIMATANGGTPPYAYAWYNNGIPVVSSSSSSNMCAGQYVIVITDANGCSILDSVTLVNPPPLAVSITTQDTLCFGNSGGLKANASGGSGALSYSWSNGITGLDSISADVPGAQYCVTVEDANGCVAVDCITPDSINFKVAISNAITVNGDKIGLITQSNAHLIQTTSSYPSQSLYSWSPPIGLSCSTCSNPSALPSTDTKYVLTATHNTLGCISQDSITVYLQATDTIYLEVAFDSTLNYCSNPTGLLAGGTSSVIGNPLNYGSITYGATGCFDYTSNGSQGTDTIVLIDCVTASLGAFPAQVCDTTIIYVTAMGCVWPGDADNDGVANNFDLLPIGLHHNATGSTRTNASIMYTCQPSLDWGATITGTPTVDIKHVDCNGNGLINGLDTNAIILNWAQTHLKSSITSATGVDIYIDTATAVPGSTVRLPIILGSAPNNGYGIAFTINYDQLGVDTNSVSIDFNNSWLGTINNDMIGISKDFYDQGQVEVGMTRIDQTTVAGSGAIGHINLTIKDDVLPKSNYLRLDFTITNVRFIDNNGTTIPTNNIPTQILIQDPNLSTSDIQNISNSTIRISPNPTNGRLFIQNSLENIDYLMVYDLTGKLVGKRTAINNKNAHINMGDLPNGIYILRVGSTTEVKSIQVIKQ